MALYNYGIGGNEVEVDANESIADIPSNRTLMVQKLTDEAPVTPETVEGLQTVEEVFEHFKPSVELELQDEAGNEIKEKVEFKNLADFGAKSLQEGSELMNRLNTEKEQNIKIAKQAASNNLLAKILANPESKEALMKVLEGSLEELEKSEGNNKIG